MEGDNPKNLQTDDLNVIIAQQQFSTATPLLSDSFNYKLQRATLLGLTFAEDMSELIQSSLASRRKVADGQFMIMPDRLSFSEIQPSQQIKLLGVIHSSLLPMHKILLP
jgi:hypothetical protein